MNRNRHQSTDRPTSIQFGSLGIVVMILTLWCSAGCRALFTDGISDRILPSNQRDWAPEFAVLPHADISDESVAVHNIRRCNYLSNDDYVVDYYDRTIPLSEIRSVDFVVVPFQNTPLLAHTMLSFELDNGQYLGVSVEIRKERGEKYSPLLGISNQFELIYVVADESDLIRVRTRHRDADVYVYPTVASREQAQTLFVDVMRRVNKLAAEPEFYHTIRNNCTTNLAAHINHLAPERIPYGWQVLLPGFSDKYAYQLGLLDNSIPFETLKAAAYVNDLAEVYYDDPDFSAKIRGKRGQLARLKQHQFQREQSVARSGAELLRR